MAVGSAMVGLGVDVVDIERLRRALLRRPGLKERVFSESERQYVSAMSNPFPSLAARFAAKEAAMKALGVGLGAFALSEVELVRIERGSPLLGCTGRAARLAASQGVRDWRVSVSHAAGVAVAVVAALG